MTRMRRRLVVVLIVAFALVAVACSGDDDSPDATPGTDAIDGDDGSGSDGSDASDGADGTTTAPAADASIDLGPVDATGDALFPCVGTAGRGEVQVAYAEVTAGGAPGGLGERFVAAIADYSRRCGGVAGGSISVEVAVADRGDQRSLCSAPGVAGALVVVANTVDVATADCLADGRLLWIEDGWPDDQAAGPAAGTEAPLSVTAGAAIAMAADEGAIGALPVVIVHDGTDRAAAGVAGAAAALEATDAELLDTLVAPCDGTDVGRDLDATMLVVLLPPTCLTDLVDEVGTAGAFVRWLVIEDGLSFAADLELADPSTFDGALAYEFAPTVTLGLPRAMAPTPRDRACNAFLDDLTGQRSVSPSAEFTAGARLCGTVAALLASLQAAGDDPTATTIADAVGGLADVPLPFGQSSIAAGVPWIAPAQAMTLEWNADCRCWTYVRGPDVVPTG